MLVKITDWQILHMFKHLISDLLKHALPDIDHQTVIYKGSDNAESKYDAKHCQRTVHFRKIRICIADQRNNIIIQKESHRKRYGDRCHRTHENTDDNDYKLHSENAGHITKQPFGRL